MKTTSIQVGKMYEVKTGRNVTTVKVKSFNKQTGGWVCETQGGKSIGVKDAARFVREIMPKKSTSTKRNRSKQSIRCRVWNRIKTTKQKKNDGVSNEKPSSECSHPLGGFFCRYFAPLTFFMTNDFTSFSRWMGIRTAFVSQPYWPLPFGRPAPVLFLAVFFTAFFAAFFGMVFRVKGCWKNDGRHYRSFFLCVKTFLSAVKD